MAEKAGGCCFSSILSAFPAAMPCFHVPAMLFYAVTAACHMIIDATP